MNPHLKAVLALKEVPFEDLFSRGDRSAKYFNTAGSAQVPIPLATRIATLREWFDREGPFGRQTNLVREEILELARSHVAAYLRVSMTDVAIMTNATEAVISLLTALDRCQIDTLLIGSHEHPSTAFPMEAIARHGLRLAPLSTPLDPVLDPARTLVVVAATSYKTGRNISDETLSALGEKGIRVVFDMTQTIGLNTMPARLLEMPNCVAVFGSCHKWMHCPQGTGFLVAKQGHADLFPDAVAGWRQIEGITDRFICASDARRFEGGTVDFAAVASMIPMFDLFAQRPFWPTLEGARRAKTSVLREALGASSHFQFTADNAGFVVLEGQGTAPWSGAELTEHVFRETGCDIKPFSAAEMPYGAVRVSLTPFNQDKDIQALGASINRFFAGWL